MDDGIRLTHVGICVRDLARSVAFYRDALGLREAGRMHVTGEATAALLDLPGLDLDLVYLERDGVRIELLAYREPASPAPGPDPRQMNRPGLTHLSLRVDDPDAVAGRIQACGGTLLAGRVVTFDPGNAGLMATDPDGTLLELIGRVARPATPSEPPATP
jgi:catechol 2,3-dioxygenase-like lactoylglutathione lyase family enzyme